MKTKVLILYNNLWHYRLPIFSILGNKYDLTVAYSIGGDGDKSFNFKTIKFPIFRIGRFVIHKKNLSEFCKEFDIVIVYGDISWLSFMKLVFVRRTFGLIFWSIGVRASYDTKFNEKTIWDIVRFYLFSKADALVFYSQAPIVRYLQKGWDKRKLFVANNTVEVINTLNEDIEKDRILFVGTLYKQKGTPELLDAYLAAMTLNHSIPDLHIIGGGEGIEEVRAFVSKHNLSDSIFIHGPIYDERVLSDHFQKSYACISPNQAGLSVLKSMGYGVPFITKSNAITGGEIFNINNGVTGLLYEKESELTDIIIDIANNPERFVSIGRSAKEHYDSCRKPSDMANGLSEAIEYVYSKRLKND
jgi:glycosyltransferase involved in cell wall biosynthesis